MRLQCASHRFDVPFSHHVVCVAKEKRVAGSGFSTGIPRVGGSPARGSIDDFEPFDAIAEARGNRQRVIARTIVGNQYFPRIARGLSRERGQLRADGRLAIEARDDDAEPGRVRGQYASSRRAARSISSSEGKNAASRGGEYGTGVSSAPRMRIGASRNSNASSWMI